MEDLSLDVAEGEVVGFLGPNGAGKTTTMASCRGTCVLAPRRGTSSCLAAGRGPRAVRVGDDLRGG
ncbi:MAG: hypothetical protein B7Z72_14135 [Gemmatimonadetes bacterium 21-71-4]|nr:MAG: hypothetical protein B7Z72_14135 [Gemmatimonadetes bacterium 21-71-4]